MRTLCVGTEVRRDGCSTLGHVVSSGRKWARVRFAQAVMRLRITELEVAGKAANTSYEPAAEWWIQGGKK